MATAVNKIETLVIGGGGVKIFHMLGGLQKLSDDGVLNLTEVKTFIGTSAGAIIGALLSVGYRPVDIFSMCTHTHSPKYDIEVAKGARILLELFGVSRSDSYRADLFSVFSEENVVERTLKNLIIQKMGIDPTMQELKDITGKELHAAVVNIDKCQCEFHSCHNYPFELVRKVVNRSSAIPLIFPRQTDPHSGDELVDGAVLNNFPINYACEHKFENVAGLCAFEQPTDHFNRVCANSQFKFISKVLNCAKNFNTKRNCNSYYTTYPIYLIKIDSDAGEKAALANMFSLTSEDKQKMYDYGYQKVEKMIDILK